MNSFNSLKVNENKIENAMGLVCVSSDIGDHFWYRNGHWEQLQSDGSYKECQEPSPKNTYRITDYKNDQIYVWDEKQVGEDKWVMADRTTPRDLNAEGLTDRGFG
jgi:hypothetical protein